MKQADWQIDNTGSKWSQCYELGRNLFYYQKYKWIVWKSKIFVCIIKIFVERMQCCHIRRIVVFSTLWAVPVATKSMFFFSCGAKFVLVTFALIPNIIIMYDVYTIVQKDVCRALIFFKSGKGHFELKEW